VLKKLNNVSDDTLNKLMVLATDNVIKLDMSLDISVGKQFYLIDKLIESSDSNITEEVLFYLLLRCGYLVQKTTITEEVEEKEFRLPNQEVAKHFKQEIL
jgi:hypothetical protein